MQRISVVFPEPFGPSHPRQRPRRTSKETSTTARVEPKRFETCSSAMMVSADTSRPRQLSFARLRSGS